LKSGFYQGNGDNNMSKSIYETYAEKRQKELLEEKRSLKQSIDLLKKNKEIFQKLI